MIIIDERKAAKVPGLTSLFLNFNYNTSIIDAIKTCDCYIFDKKTKLWEVPISELSKLLDSLYEIDDIQLNLLEDNTHKQDSDYILNNYITKPFEYQQEGIKYGLNHDKWLLLDAPGLGKSLQIIYTALELKERKNIKHCLIICGVNTLKSNWKKEIQKHSNESVRILGERYRKSGELYFSGIKDRLDDLKSNLSEFFIITNIETLRNNDIVKEINNGKNSFDMIVIDEVHHAKNVSSQQGKNFLKLNKAKYKIAATGTLLTNSPTDAFVPLKWIGVVNCSNSTFKYYFTKYGGPFNNEILGYRHMDILKNILDTCSLRRTKDLLDLPEINYIDEYIDMNDTQQVFYENMVKGIVDNVDKVTIDTSSIFSMVARLRQATACPSILTSEDIQSSKIERCLDLIDQIVENNEKVVVFSTFKETLYKIYSQLKSDDVLLCTGDIKEDIISDNIDKFQNDSQYKVMLATWQKMGTGITLTASNNVIFIDTPYTQADTQQAIDRCHRIGSNKSVFVYFLICKDTIDERVKEIVDDKELISDYVIDDKVSPALTERLKSIILDLS